MSRRFSRWMLLIAFVPLLSFACVDNRASAQVELSWPHVLPKLKPVVGGVFSEETRDDYVPFGEPEWEDQGVVLSRLDGVGYEAALGAWVELDIDLEMHLDKTPESKNQTWIRLGLNGATDLLVIWIRQTVNGELSTQLAVYDTEGEGAEQGLVLVRAWNVPQDVSGSWKVTYRYGLVSLIAPYVEQGQANPTEYHAYVDNLDAELVYLIFRQGSGQSRLKEWSLKSTRRAEEIDEIVQLQADQLLAAAKQHFAKRELDEARAKLEQLIKHRQAKIAEAPFRYARSVNDLAEVYTDQGNSQSVIRCLKVCREIRRKLLGERHPHYIYTLSSLARRYEALAEFEQAKTLMIESRELTGTTLGELHTEYAVQSSNLAGVYQSLDDHETAERLYREAASILKDSEGESDLLYITVLGNLSTLLVRRGDYEEAEILCRRTLELLREGSAEETSAYVTGLNNLANVLADTGRVDQAQELYKQYLAGVERESGTDHADYAVGLANLAELSRRAGRLREAEEYTLQAIKIRQTQFPANHPSLAPLLETLGLIYRAQAEFARAEALFRQAAAINEAAFGNDSIAYATSLYHLASIQSYIFDYDRAINTYEQVAEIYRKKLGVDSAQYGSVVGELGSMEYYRKNYVPAETNLRRSIEVFKALESVDVRQESFERSLAMLLRATGKWDKAKALLEQLLRQKPAEWSDNNSYYAVMLSELAQIHYLQGDYRSAAERKEQALQVRMNLAEQRVPLLSHAEASNWLLLNRPRPGLMLDILAKDSDANAERAHQLVWRTKSFLSRWNRSQRMPKNASSETQQLFDELTKVRSSMSLLITSPPVSETPEETSARLRTLNERKEQLERKLGAVAPLTDQQRLERESSVAQLVERLPRGVAVIDFFQAMRHEPREQLVEVLNDQGQSESRKVKQLEIVNRYEAFILRGAAEGQSQRVHWISLPEEDEIDDLVTQFRQGIGSVGQTRSLDGVSQPLDTVQSSKDPGQQLRQRLWERLEPHLENCHTVIILPDGELSALPWGALPGRQPRSYLVEDYAIGTSAYGQQLLSLLSSDYPIGDGAVVVGNLDYGQASGADGGSGSENTDQQPEGRDEQSGRPRSWPSLPGTADEVSSITKTWGVTNSKDSLTSLSGKEVDEAILAESIQSRRWVHLATHGYFATTGSGGLQGVDQPENSLTQLVASKGGQVTVGGRDPLLLSGVVLSGANGEPGDAGSSDSKNNDGVLTAQEVIGIDMSHVELVTLSACETGLGRFRRHEGVLGLQRAFHQAGARSVVASLWRVDDAATQALMVEFYKNLWQKKLGKLEALRQAQLAMIRRYNPQRGQLRGLGNRSQKVEPEKPGERQLSPFYWAAFQLSGDWR